MIKCDNELKICTKEQIIKNFLQQMANQDNRGAAFPYFYVIRTEVYDIATLDDCDSTKFYWNGDSYDSIEEIIELYSGDDSYSSEELKIQIENIKKEAREYGLKKRFENRGMFLTETDAKKHLELNYYHYSDNAHTYVCHAWRSRELKEFFEYLFDYFKINKD